MLLPSRITTKRLALRPFRESDLAGLVEFVTDADATKFMLIPDDRKNREGARFLLDFVMNSYQSAEPVFSLTIADTNNDEFYGFCQLFPYETPGCYELVYAVLPKWQGKGIATEASLALVEYAFNCQDVNEIVGFVVPANLPSVRVIKKLGFVKAGPTVHHGREAVCYRLKA